MTESDDGNRGDWADVAEVRQRYEADLVVLRLREAGIDAEVVSQSFELMPLPDNRDFENVRVVVPASRADEARRVLASQMASIPEDGEVAPEGEE